MKVIQYQDPLKFQSAVKDYLIYHEAENNLPLGILANLIAGEYQETSPYLAQVVDKGETRLVVMRTPPFPALFSFDPDPLEEEIINLVINDLNKTFGDEFTGITAVKSMAAQLVESWQAATGKTPLIKMAMRIYKLEHVKPVSSVSGSIRPANTDDSTLVLEWYGNFHRDALREEPDPEQVKKQTKRYLNADPIQRGLMIWEVEGNPVSMAGYAGPTTNGIRIGAVYTPPYLRKKGYASACTAGLSQHLLDLGFKFCFLFTDLMNPTSNHIYQQIGYEAVSDVDSYEFK